MGEVFLGGQKGQAAPRSETARNKAERYFLRLWLNSRFLTALFISQRREKPRGWSADTEQVCAVGLCHFKIRDIPVLRKLKRIGFRALYLTLKEPLVCTNCIP